MGGGVGRRNKDECFKCGEEGHFARDCRPERREMGKGRGGEREGDRSRGEVYVPDESLEENLYLHGVNSGINFSKYENIPVKVTGEEVPEKIDSFADANLQALIMTNIAKSKYQSPTPVQKYALPMVLAGRDVMACAQTGSGKTAAFLVPIIHKLLSSQADAGSGMCVSPQALVITPTRELALQIYNEARKFAQGSTVKPVVVYGGTSTGYQARKLENGCNILVATPGRLLDYVEKGRVSFKRLEFLVLDEADRMLDMGFMPEIQKCVENQDMPDKGKRQTLMFSATFPDDIQTAAQEFLNDYLFCTVGLVGGACSDVEQTFYEVAKFDKREKLEELLNDSDRDPNERTLIFVQTKKNADFLASHLSQEGLPTTSIHGDRLQREREEALYDFRTGTMPILVATAEAARGLDIPGVAHVINYDVPSDVDEYVHRIGRTGRLGNLGKATSFYDAEQDAEVASAVVQMLAAAGIAVPDWLAEAGESSGGVGNNAVGGGDDDDDEW